MTRKSIIARENKRLKTVKKYAAKRVANGATRIAGKIRKCWILNG